MVNTNDEFELAIGVPPLGKWVVIFELGFRTVMELRFTDELAEGMIIPVLTIDIHVSVLDSRSDTLRSS